MCIIRRNLDLVEARIQAACVRSGRNRDEVTLIAVSKTRPVSDIREAMKCGITVFGENKVQELRDKTDEITEPLHWHMIGHLQVNKVKYLPGKTDLIHSLDNLKLAAEIEKQAEKNDMVMDVLCEVNMAGEDTKFGLAPEQVEDFLNRVSDMRHMRVKGLMTIAPYTEDPESNRIYFRKLKELMIRMNDRKILSEMMDTLSMGMTGDYETAIEEGATFVRVGTGIFGARSYNI